MKRFASLFLLLALAMPASPLLAQAVSNVSGTIEAVMIDDGYIVIDGKRLAVRAADLVISYKGQPVRPSLLSAGLTVFYSTRNDGSLRELTLIGPASVLDAIEQ